MRAAGARGADLQQEWEARVDAHPEAPTLRRIFARDLPDGWSADLPRFTPGEDLATRAASGKVIEAIAGKLPELVGGSADLTPSNNTKPSLFEDFQPDNPSGRYIRYGVREHAMAAITNGLVLSNLRAYAGTFFNFLDYCKPAVRIASLMHCPSIWVFTHDSVGLGEDGPTHQPIEQLATLRAQPNVTTFRPADANETSVGWRIALERGIPTALVLSRQKLPVLDPDRYPVERAERGGYVLDGDDDPEVVLIATGSEVHLLLEARASLSERGVRSRVVSLPSWELFEEQDREYRESVLPPDVTARVTVEAASPVGWERYAGLEGEIIGLTRFGASAPGTTALEKLGFTPERVVEAAERALSRRTRAA
jgi:transketolase